MRTWKLWIAVGILAVVAGAAGTVVLSAAEDAGAPKAPHRLMLPKPLEKADVEPGNKPGDTPFSEIMTKILGPALLLGVIGWAIAEYLLPGSVTKLVRPTDFGFLLGAIPILLFFVRLSHKAKEEE